MNESYRLSQGGLWPIWIAEHYSDRTSQHPLDPYSFAHVSHGTLGYVFTYTFGKFNINIH